MGEVKYTELPWEGRNDGLILSQTGNARFILRIERHGPAATLDDEDRACMDLVLRAVNTYAADQEKIAGLVEALRSTVEVVEAMRSENKLHGHITDATANYLLHVEPQVRAALKLAEGKEAKVRS